MKHEIPLGEQVAQTVTAIELLVASWPRIHGLLGDQLSNLDEYAGWEATKKRLEAFQTRQMPAALVTVLYGPTGAGKSTIFRHITNLDVPIDIVRPWTHAVLVGMPRGELDSRWLQTVFPESELIPCGDLSVLMNSGPIEQLYFASSDSLPLTEGFVGLLVDLPDFNSIDQGNWKRAKRIVDLAQQVVFIASHETYKDRRVVNELSHVCAEAASLIFVLTKVPSRAARQGKVSTSPRETATRLWNDLTEYAENAPEFSERRTDGRSFAAFLHDSCCYYVPYSETPTEGISVETLSPDQPRFSSRLVGIDGEAMLVAGLLEPAFQLAKECQRDLARIPERQVEIDRRLASARQCVRKVAKHAARHLPLGRLLQIAFEEADAQRSLITTITGILVRPVRRGITLVYRKLREWRNSKHNVQETALLKLEVADIRQGLLDCCESWRSEFSNSTRPGEVLAAANIKSVQDSFWNSEYPKPSEGWESTTRDELKEWAKKYWWFIEPVNLLADALMLAAPILVTVDVFVAGGLGTLGLIAIGGGLAAAGGVVLELLRAWRLEGAAQTAQKAWSKQRSRELYDHLDLNFVSMLFAPWREEQEALREVPLAEVQCACNAIRRLAKGTGAKI